MKLYWALIRGSAQIGTAKSKRSPTETPKKLGGVTPTMGKGWPSRVSVLPITDASPP